MGYLATVDSYENYHLSLEYRWGEKVDGSGYVRNSGILLHANGPDGNARGIWMASVECQLAQGCEGDLIVIRGKDADGKIIPVTLASDTIVGVPKERRRSFPRINSGGLAIKSIFRNFWTPVARTMWRVPWANGRVSIASAKQTVFPLRSTE